MSRTYHPPLILRADSLSDPLSSTNSQPHSRVLRYRLASTPMPRFPFSSNVSHSPLAFTFRSLTHPLLIGEPLLKPKNKCLSYVLLPLDRTPPSAFLRVAIRTPIWIPQDFNFLSKINCLYSSFLRPIKHLCHDPCLNLDTSGLQPLLKTKPPFIALFHILF